MTTTTYPTSRLFVPAEFSMRLQRNLSQRANPITRRRKTIEHAGALWIVTITYAPHSWAEMAQLEAWWNAATDADIVIALWHLARPLPRGTLQANTTTSASAAEGASAISVNATTGLTLLAGDMLSVVTAAGVQLVQVVADITSSAGVMTGVSFVPPLVAAVNSGAAVVVDKPTSLFRLEEPVVPAVYQAGHAPAFAVVLVEDPAW